MDFTLTDINGQEKGPLEHSGVEFVLGTDNDFEIKIQESLYDSDKHGKNCRFFCPETEYGGLIRSPHPVTGDKIVKLTGMSWRGLLNQRALSPSEVNIDQSIDFGSTAAAFAGDQSKYDYTVEFEPSATALETEGKGYVVASLGTDSGYVPYTAFSAKKSYLDQNPEVIQGFVNALQKGMDYVQSHSPEEIAKVIAPQFDETDLETITKIVTRYYEQDTWKADLVFEEDSFNLLQDILEDAGELAERAPYKDLVTTEFAEKAIQ